MSNKRKAKNDQRVKAMPLVPANDPKLSAVATLEIPNDEWYRLGKNLVATARRCNRMAVAAPQVGIDIRLVGLHDGRIILNPSLTDRHGRQVGSEGCLSLPGRWWRVERYNRVGVAGVHPLTGEPIECEAVALEARMWQHEIDHLDGLLLSEGGYEEIIDRDELDRLQ